MIATIQQQRVSIEAPARLHFGFVDLHGGTGRRFGSLGMTLDNVSTQLQARPAQQIHVSGEDSERAGKIATRLFSALNLSGGIELNIDQVIPPHSGLGSGTQMALAVGGAISELYGLNLNAREIATLLDRGARSGVGIGAYDQGGFIVDGGRCAAGGPPAVISRLEFPEHWRVVLIFDDSELGLHGEQETTAFRELPEFSPAKAGELCRLLMMKALPGLVDQDIQEFGSAVAEIQAVVGDYFAPAQGGRFASPAVAKALEWLPKAGYPGIGQSSWGPTGFILVDGETQAYRLSRELQTRFPDESLRYQVVSGRNIGARTVRDADSPHHASELNAARASHS